MLFVAIPDPNDVITLDELKFRTSLRITPLLASEAQIREGIDRHYGSPKDVQLRKVFEDLPDHQEEQESSDLQVVGEESTVHPTWFLLNTIRKPERCTSHTHSSTCSWDSSPEPTRNIFTQDYMTLLGFGNMNPEQLLKERILPSLPKHKNRIPLEVQSLFTKTSAAGN